MGNGQSRPTPTGVRGNQTGDCNVHKVRVRRLAATVSAIAISAAFAPQANAATVEGVRQEDSGTIAVNLYEVPAGETVEFGTTDQASNPGGIGTAVAAVLCAQSATCTAPGAIEQFASGTDEALNTISIAGTQQVVVLASADGATASATAFIDTAIAQLAISGGKAANIFEVTGSLSVLASADAAASEGDAGAFAIVSHAAAIAATGNSAAINVANNGDIAFGAAASAQATGGGTTDDALAYALVAGLTAKAVATGTGEGASVVLDNQGSIAVLAGALASADGAARATATAIYGLAGHALATGDGDAVVTLANAGDVSVIGNASAIGGHAATAVGIGIGGLVAIASAQGEGDASVEVVNDGAVIVGATAHAQADTNALAVAIGVTGVYDIARAATGDALVSFSNTGSIAVGANATATALVAQATAVGGGALFSGGVYQSAAAANGSAHGILDNDGDILVSAHAAASGSVIAYANAFGGPGVNQFVFATNGDAISDLTNSGSITLSADAEAIADNSAIAHAFYFNALVHSAFAGPGGDALVNLVNDGDVLVDVLAKASGDNFASATAFATNNVGQVGFAFFGGDASVDMINNGTIDVVVGASAVGDTAFAGATIQKGVFQTAVAIFGGIASADLTNAGAINIAASAIADGGAGTDGLAIAVATVLNAVYQDVSAIAATTTAATAGNAVATLDNQGSIEVGAFASGEGTIAGNARAVLSGGVVQLASAGVGAPAAATDPDLLASVNLLNSGDIALGAGAIGAGSSAVAQATVVGGLSQVAVASLGNGSAVIENDGAVDIQAAASADGGMLFSRANAVVYGGFFQSVEGATGEASALFSNNGDFTVGANANADGESIVIAFAQAFGGGQEALAFGDELASVSFDNDGNYTIEAVAGAAVTPTDSATGVIFANAGAQATGLQQFSNHGSANFANSGSFDIHASAQSTGPKADGFAVAQGVNQAVAGSDAEVAFDNDGDFSVEAEFAGEGDQGFGFVIASGYRATGEALTAQVENSGDIEVIANGSAGEGVSAAAAGIVLQAAVASSAPATALALLDGSVANSGNLYVAAFASGGLVTTGTGTTATEVPGSNATATGIALLSGANAMTVTNSGTIAVEAVTGGGGDATAYGIRVAGNGTGAVPVAGTVLTITNDGGNILVRESADGGATYQRGMAIDVTAAPNPTIVNLLGDATIYGNIAINAADVINVESGTTYFDGVINPAFLPAGGITEADLDTGLAGVGTLNIGNGGNLVLADPRLTGDPAMYDGPAYAFVDTLNVATDGTLTFELQPDALGDQPVGTYPQVFANTANLDGTLVASLATTNGLFDDVFYDNLIDATTRNGTFDQCLVGGIPANSLLLDAECVYDDQANVDLTLTRTPFDQVPGLNRNGTSVGSGLECIFDVTLTGGIADLLADLFLIDNEVDFNTALNILAGEG